MALVRCGFYLFILFCFDNGQRMGVMDGIRLSPGALPRKVLS